jgi:hypothetical protein
MNLFYAKLRESYQRQELLILREYLGSPPFFGGVRVADLFSFCVVLFVLFFTEIICFCHICVG